MSLSKLRITYNTKTRKHLRAATEDWKRSIIEQSNRTCWVTGKKQNGKNGVYLTVHHSSERTFNSISKQAHSNLGISYHHTTTDYGPGELNAVMDEIARIHREEHIEGICICKEWHDRLHKEYGPHATMDQLREMRRSYRKMNHNNRNGVYKSKRSA